MKKIVQKFDSFDKQQDAEHEYWADKTPEERMEQLQRIREGVHEQKYGKKEHRIEKVARVIKPEDNEK